ncbi:MAG: ribonuclease P protein component [Patescibacteria group bacterium]|nr:ribonuclease P protein component [Patescibacteria group bacterium]
MLAKKYLLNKKEVFLLKQRGKPIYKTDFFNVIALKIPDENILKFTFIISKKASKKAVERNRAKRMLAKAIQVNLGKFNKGYHIGFYLNEKIITADYEEIYNLVTQKISKISLL